MKFDKLSRILIPTEAVTINQIKPLDTGYSVKYTGINSNLQKSKIITLAEFEQLDILTAAGSFNFTASVGYAVTTIHGGKSVDERRAAQIAFAKPDTQILI